MPKNRRFRQKGAGGGVDLERNRAGMGTTGECVCVKCGYTVKKEAGIPCLKVKCPVCGSVLLRKGGRHYNDAMEKKF